MKRILTFALAFTLSLATLTPVIAAPFQDTTHKTKSGKLDRRYNANKHLKKDGTMDMRYKSSKKASTKMKKDTSKKM